MPAGSTSCRCCMVRWAGSRHSDWGTSLISPGRSTWRRRAAIIRPATMLAAVLVWQLVGLVGWYFVVMQGSENRDLVWPALPYSLLLAGTAGVTSGLALVDRRLVALAVGAALFLASDLILAFGLFRGHFSYQTEAVCPDTWISSTEACISESRPSTFLMASSSSPPSGSRLLAMCSPMPAQACFWKKQLSLDAAGAAHQRQRPVDHVRRDPRPDLA